MSSPRRERPCPGSTISAARISSPSISNTAGGYCFYKDARLSRILRYRYNEIPPRQQRTLFLHPRRRGHLGPGLEAGPARARRLRMPARPGLYPNHRDPRRRQGGLPLFRAPRDPGRGASGDPDQPVRAGQAPRALFSFVEWCLWNALDDMTNFQRNLNTGEVEVEGSVIYHKTEYRERRNHYAFYGVNAPAGRVRHGSRRASSAPTAACMHPRRWSEGRARNSVAHGWAPIASHHLQVDLPPAASGPWSSSSDMWRTIPEKKWAAPGSSTRSRPGPIMAHFATG